jgi:GNAT superfamily N-acetyltransferase
MSSTFPADDPTLSYAIVVVDIEDAENRRAIGVPLIAYNLSRAAPPQYRHLAVLLKDRAGAVIGGLWGNTAYDWLTVYLLAVPEALRGRGVGTEIMRLAEAEARARGCAGAWLDTIEFQARGFYEKLGYTCFGELPDYPRGFSKFFMRKLLAPTP